MSHYVVTGATSGIGRATVHHLAAQGHTVSAIARDESALRCLQGETHGAAHPCPADLLQLDTIPPLVDSICTTQGAVHGLVNCAGVIASGAIADTSDDDLERMMRLNVHAPFALMRACYPALRESKGAVVNVSSVTGSRPFPNLAPYCVSKAALDHLTRCAAIEWAADGIRVNAINPGVIRTNLHKRGGMDEEAYADFLARTVGAHPLGRVGEPEEAAELIAFLLSDGARWITGACVPLDGGRHLTAAR